jgi:hypothetical protein
MVTQSMVGLEIRNVALPEGRALGLWSRVEAAVNVAKTVGGDVGIDFGGGDGGVAEEFLDDAEISAVLEQVRGEAVSEHMRSDVTFDAGHAGAFLDAQPKRHRGERSSALGEENIPGRMEAHELGAGRFKVELERLDGFASDRHSAFFVAFAENGDEAGIEVELFESDLAEFGEA